MSTAAAIEHAELHFEHLKMARKFMHSLLVGPRRSTSPVSSTCNEGIVGTQHYESIARTLLQGGVTAKTLLIAATLHQALNDSNATFEEIKYFFGDQVAALVQEVSHDKNLSRVDRLRSLLDRADKFSHAAKTILLADLLEKVICLTKRPLKSWSVDMHQAYFAWSYKLLLALGNVNKPLYNKALDVFNGHYTIGLKSKPTYRGPDAAPLVINVTLPCLPPDNKLDELVERYYEQC